MGPGVLIKVEIKCLRPPHTVRILLDLSLEGDSFPKFLWLDLPTYIRVVKVDT